MQQPLWFVEWPQVADICRWQAYNFDNGCKKLSYVYSIERSFSRAEFNSSKDLRRSWGLVKFIVLDSRLFLGAIWKLNGAYLAHVPFHGSALPISPLTKFVEFVAFRRTYWRSPEVILKLGRYWRDCGGQVAQPVVAVAYCALRNNRSPWTRCKELPASQGEFVEKRECREETPYQCNVSRPS